MRFRFDFERRRMSVVVAKIRRASAQYRKGALQEDHRACVLQSAPQRRYCAAGRQYAAPG